MQTFDRSPRGYGTGRLLAVVNASTMTGDRPAEFVPSQNTYHGSKRTLGTAAFRRLRARRHGAALSQGLTPASCRKTNFSSSNLWGKIAFAMFIQLC